MNGIAVILQQDRKRIGSLDATSAGLVFQFQTVMD